MGYATKCIRAGFTRASKRTDATEDHIQHDVPICWLASGGAVNKEGQGSRYYKITNVNLTTGTHGKVTQWQHAEQTPTGEPVRNEPWA